MPPKSKALLLFTATFPDGPGETFLSDELTFLAKGFESVTIVPLWEEPGARRPVPSNVHVDEPLFPARLRRLVVLRRGLWSRAPLSPLLSDARRAAERASIDRFARCAYSGLLVRALLSNQRLLGNLAPDSGHDVAYFYWATGAVNLLPFLPKTIPTVARFHGYDLYEDLYDDYLPLRPQLAARLDHLVFVSSHGMEYFAAHYPEARARSVVHRLGVADHGLAPPPRPGAPLQLLSCAFAMPLKRLHLIAQAIRLIEFPITWTHLGDGPELPRVRELCRELPAHVQVQLPGHLPHEAVLEHFRKQGADLFVNVSETEGVPVSVMEALSFGVPVLATDVGGTSEIVAPAWGQLLPADATPSRIARGIAELRAGDQDRRREAARGAWAELANGPRNFSAFAEFLHRVADGSQLS